MKDKNQIISMLEKEFKRWEELLNEMDQEQIPLPKLPSGLSIKDVVAHLWAWQQRSIARLEAAQENREPRYPDWPPAFDPEIEGDPHELNDWIFRTYREKSWQEVYSDWREGFSRFIELAQSIPERDLFNKEKYSWLEGYSLSDVLLGSYEHHHDDHLETLQAWLEGNEATRSSGGVPDEQSLSSDELEDGGVTG